MTISEEQFAKVKAAIYNADGFLTKLDNDFQELKSRRTEFFNKMGVTSVTAAKTKIEDMKNRLEVIQNQIVTEAIEYGLVDPPEQDIGLRVVSSLDTETPGILDDEP